MERKENTYDLDIRVYYEDTDAGGIVYHASYLKYAERGRTEFLRHIGFKNSDLRQDEGVIFVARHIDINYIKPAFLDDKINLTTSIKSLKNTSFVMHQCAIKDGVVITDMHVALVCVRAQTYKPVRLPENVKEAFQSYLEDLK